MYALRREWRTLSMFKMVGGNDADLLWRMNFSRQVFLFRIITMLVYQTFKLSYVRLRRLQEIWYRETVNRIEKYSRWRSRRNQRMIQSLISIRVVQTKNSCEISMEQEDVWELVALTWVQPQFAFTLHFLRSNPGSTHLQSRVVLT